MVGDRVAQVLIDRGGEFMHGYTYSGHPVACAVALANLDLMEREQLPQRVKGELGAYLARRYAELTSIRWSVWRNLRLHGRLGAGQEQGHSRAVFCGA